MSRNLFVIASLMLLAAGRVHALADDHSQPITLKADRVEINQKKGMSVYEGSVELKQGSMVITASRIVLHHTANQVTHLEADGTPVTIRQRPAPNKDETRAEARHIEYDPKTATVRLTGQAHIWQDGNEFSGETITYDSRQSIVRASGGAATSTSGGEPKGGQTGEQKKERVEVIIKPRKETTP